MKKLFSAILLAIVFMESGLGAVNPCTKNPNLEGCSPIDHPNQPVTWEVIHSFSVGLNPESVLTSGEGIYVSTMGKETGPIKNGDGSLSRYKKWGQLDKRFSIDFALHSPMGMALIGDSLFVADIDRVVAISTKDGSFQFEVLFENESVSFLNDIVAINSRYLIASATDREAIYLVDTKLKEFKKLNVSLSHPNGLAYDSRNEILYISGNKKHALGEFGNGSISAIKLKNNDIEQVLFQNSFGHFLDGIATRGDTLLVSDWKDFKRGSSLYTFRIFTKMILREQDMFTHGLADFSLEPDGRSMAIPDLINSKIHLLEPRNP